MFRLQRQGEAVYDAGTEEMRRQLKVTVVSRGYVGGGGFYDKKHVYAFYLSHPVQKSAPQPSNFKATCPKTSRSPVTKRNLLTNTFQSMNGANGNIYLHHSIMCCFKKEKKTLLWVTHVYACAFIWALRLYFRTVSVSEWLDERVVCSVHSCTGCPQREKYEQQKSGN